MQFTKAIVRTPCKRIIEGISTAGLGLPDYDLVLQQHSKYVKALEACGLEVTVLPSDNDYPDSSFVEDTALLTPAVAVITNPGAPSRKGEVREMEETITRFYDKIEHIRPPGTLEAGDVMMAGSHYFIGLSERTNIEGANQLVHILKNHGMTASIIEISGMLHLKSGVSYLENNALLAVNALGKHPDLSHFDIISVPDNEAYAANSLWLNGTVLVPEGYPVTLENIRSADYKAIVLDVSEFRKLDGGLSCLSLRF